MCVLHVEYYIMCTTFSILCTVDVYLYIIILVCVHVRIQCVCVCALASLSYSQVNVLFPDYGNQEWVSVSDLCTLRPQFYTLPFQVQYALCLMSLCVGLGALARLYTGDKKTA